MSLTQVCKVILFYQKPFTAETEQLGCYYFNVLTAVELCKKWGVRIVPPLLPLCPRDNQKVEKDPSRPWSESIYEISSISSDKVFDFSGVDTISMEELVSLSNGSLKMPMPAVTKGTTFRGYSFKQDLFSEYWMMEMPTRWDLAQKDPYAFYNYGYSMLPLLSLPLNLLPVPLKHQMRLPFLGVHWRRGDRGNWSLGLIGDRLWKSTQPIQVAEQINQYLEKAPELEWVFVSTNSGSYEDRKSLVSSVKKQVYFLDRPSSVEPRQHWQWDICDLLICASTNHILLSPGGIQHSSAFGRLIMAECYRNFPETAVISFLPMI